MRNLKGVELPVNVLVILAIAVIVLLGLILLYVVTTSGPTGLLAELSAVNKACGTLKTGGCVGSTSGVTIDWPTGSERSLSTYCEEKPDSSKYEDAEAYCKVIVCGCTNLPAPKQKAGVTATT
ncbi:MAG: hypothetical protein HY362_03690 [Candidatus Aenigmarchaeota archaeon]|nr:hypothetical protein [Candidatus Aenigmarchaeota archaeon]